MTTEALVRKAESCPPGETTQDRGRRWEPWALAAVLFLALSLRLEMLSVRSLWHDEAFSLEVARRPVGYIWTNLPRVDPHPPGYYLMLQGWIRLFGGDVASARTLSVVWGMVGVVLAWGFGRRLGGPAVGVAAAALVALNPFQIYNSNEVRMYAPLTAAAVLSTWMLHRADRRNRDLDWALYGVTAAFLLYLSYYAGPLVVAHGVWMALRRRWRGLLVGGSTGLLLYLPWLPALGRSLFANPIPYRDPMRPTYGLEVFAVHAFGGYLLGMPGYLRWPGLEWKYQPLLVFPFAVLAAAGVGELWRRDRGGCGLLILCWALPVAVFVLASLVLRREAAYFYHLAHLQPFVAVALGSGIVGLREAARRASPFLVSALAAAGVLLFLWPAIDNLQGNPAYQGFRYDLAARHLRAHYRPTDVVVYYMGGAQAALHRYFDPPGPEIAIDPDVRRWNREAMREHFQEAVRLLRPEHRRIWLVLVSPVPPGSTEDLVRGLESRGYRRGPLHDFNGVRVGLMYRQGPPRAAP
ncbi:MAG: glycosyltransferase family 39 protein [Armatimonadota bacterium]|nr:glycosyltransferase family 39 protein [Armatimonadota bacterium]MDR7444212.1 glycosyltransferase family 39 protein [Armatimonadota bacterium]MDR7570578.1 glycosyltransferase family 39 protein [Armatimonadota bacterium]MDR7614253.1 glycosyltransferase family 39 protein [Armatimonadota bacterium]